MMPYERMGALLSEDAEDYINRLKYKQQLKQQQMQQQQLQPGSTAQIPEPTNELLPHNSTGCPQIINNPSEIQYTVPTNNSSTSIPTTSFTSSNTSTSSDTSTSSTTYDQSSVSSSSIPSSSASSSGTYSPNQQQVSSIFSCESANPGTNHEMQVNPKNPTEAVHPQVSHFHPPFLIIDSRREDEYVESHIHGVCS
jgi:hypothetical protein